ncbi:MAG: hypothetical protein M1822_005609 [Bathelium mastoideum]|nr:MAG: hypothetical protein M1822_005609 [Bathelium mastoideum]
MPFIFFVLLLQHGEAAWITSLQAQQPAVAVATLGIPSPHVVASGQEVFFSHVHYDRRIIRRLASEDGNTATEGLTTGVGDYIMSGLNGSGRTGSSAGSLTASALNTTGSSPTMSASSVSASSVSASPVSASSLPATPLSTSSTNTTRFSESLSSGAVFSSEKSTRANNPTGLSDSAVSQSNVTSTATVSSALTTQYNSSSLRLTAAMSKQNASFTYGPVANGSVESCWNQWQSYWSLYDLRFTPVGLSSPTSTSVGTTTETAVLAFTYDSPSGTSTTTDIYTQTQGVDGFGITTITSTLVQTYVISSAIESTSTESYTRTEESTSLYYSPVPTNLTPPPCALPTYLPQCQSQWDSYLSAQAASSDPFGVPPQCSQATARPGQCVSLRSQYLATWNDGAASALNWGYGDQTIGEAATEVTIVNGTSTNFGVTSWWPTSSTLFPGCTVGCLSCAITGGKVQLIYWPEGTAMTSNTTASSRLSSPASAVPRNTTSVSEVDDIESSIRIAMAFGTTFTSPTVYISYAKIYASDSCSGVGGTYFNTIVPITHSADLSSLWATMDYGAAGLNSASFNYTDLNTPVPDSIYDRQPRCAQYSNAQATWLMHDGPDTEPTSCPRTLPYEPIIIVPPSILRSIDPTWASCSGDIRGVYDPPYALSSYSVAAAPVATTTGAQPSISAAPASVSPAPTPKSTSDPNDPGSIVSSIWGGNKPSASDPGTQAAAPPSRNSQFNAVSSTNDPIGGIVSAIAGGKQSSTQDGSGTQADPTISSAGVAAGGNIASLLNGEGDSSAQSATKQTSAPVSQHAAAQTPSSISAVNDNSAPPATNKGGAASPAASLAQQESAANSPAASAPSVQTIVGGQTISADTANPGRVVVGSQTLQPGVQTTIDSTPISVGQQGSVVVATSSIVNVASVPQQVGGQSIAADPATPGGVVVAGQTLPPGAETTVHNTPISVGQDGTVAVGGSTTINAGSAPQIVGGQSIAADPSKSGGVVVEGQTLEPGALTTIDNTPVSVGQTGAVAIGDTTVKVSPLSEPAVATSASALATIGSQVISVDPSQSGAVVIDGSQILQQGEATTVGNTPVSVGAGGVVIGGGSGGSSTIALQSTPYSLPIAINTVGGQAITATSGQPVAVGGITLTAGGPATTVGDQALSLGSQGLVIGSSTATYSDAESPALPNAATVTIGGSTYTASSNSPLVIGSNTLSVGGPAATISGQAISLGPQGVVVDSSTVSYSAAPEGGEGAVVTVGGNLYSASSGAPLVVGSTTLSAGGPAQTIDGQRISVGSNGLIIGSSTVAYSSSSVFQGAVIALGGNLYTASSGVPLVIGSKTLSAGGPAITINGQRISIGSQGAVIDSITEPYSAIGSQLQLPEVAITLGSQAYTALESGGKVVLGSVTLTPGDPAQTISGETISAAPSGIVVDGTTQPFSTPPPVLDGITAASEASFTIAGHSYTALEVAGHSGEVFIPGATSGSFITLSVGGPAATISGQVISAAPSGVVVGTSTITYASATPVSAPVEVEAPFTLGGSSFTAFEVYGHSREVVVPSASITLSVGGPATTLAGETISAASNGLVIDGSTDTFATVMAATLPIVPGATIGPWDGTSTTESARSSSSISQPSGPLTAPSAAAKSILHWQWVVLTVLFHALIISFLP